MPVRRPTAYVSDKGAAEEKDDDKQEETPPSDVSLSEQNFLDHSVYNRSVHAEALRRAKETRNRTVRTTSSTSLGLIV